MSNMEDMQASHQLSEAYERIDALEKQLGEAQSRGRVATDGKAYVTTEDCCSECGSKLENAETSRLQYQREAHSMAVLLDETKAQLHAFEAAMEREKKPEWSQSLTALADRLMVHNKLEDRRQAAIQLKYMADSFTLKANFVPAELRIKELEAEIASCRKIPGFEDGHLAERLERFTVWHKQQLQAHQQALKEAKVALAGEPAERMKCIERISSVLGSKGDE